MTPLLPAEKMQRLSGFGQFAFADGYVYSPTNTAQIIEVFELAKATGRQVALRGAHRSYGDAAIAAECLVIDLCAMNKILGWDPQTGVVEAEPGATLSDLWHKTLPDGWYLPVVSGTTLTSLGGALAMNIHGKNNWAHGPLGEHVVEFDLLTPKGETLTVHKEDELFYQVIGGLGLLGAITRVKLQMNKVPSGEVRVQAVSCRNWSEQFAAFEQYEGKCDYIVSWIDCFAQGASAGRGILHVAWYEDGDPSTLGKQDLPAKVFCIVPKSSVWRFLKLLNHRAGMKFVNGAKHFAGARLEHGKSKRQSLAAFNFLLDYVPGWEKAYLPGGLIQCQFFIPKAEAPRVFAELTKLQQEAKLESFLSVMKRHRPDKFLLSHAVDGYSLALDFKVTEPNRSRLLDLARRMNDLALAAGGRFYFAKDSTLTAAQAHAFLGDALSQFREVKKSLDPDNLLTSDLARRLEL